MYLEIFKAENMGNDLSIMLSGVCDTFSSVIWDVEY